MIEKGGGGKKRNDALSALLRESQEKTLEVKSV